MKISELARAARVGVETIRYYEREGLLPQPPKPRSGYRQYTAAHLDRLLFLKQCQTFGFTLAEAATLADSLDHGSATCEQTCALAERKLAELERRITEYQTLASRLQRLLDSPCRRSASADCNVLRALGAPTPASR